MDNAEDIALAAALEVEFGDLQHQLKSLSQQEDPVLFEQDANELTDKLPALLAAAAGMTYATGILESILATRFAEGVAEASRAHIYVTGKLMRPERAYAAVAASLVLDNAANKLPATIKDIRVRAAAVSKVLKGQIVQDLRNQLVEMDGEAPEQAQALSASVAKELDDLSHNKRLQNHVRVQAELAKGYGMFSAQQSEAYLRAIPFQEFYRAEHRVEWRDWPERWAKFGGRFFEGPADYAEGRMIAETNSKIWEDLCNTDHYSDATGSPYPPFAFNSGMSVKPVTVAEAKRLGLHGAHRVPQKPKKLSFNAGIQFSADFDDDVKSALLDSMQDWVEKKEEFVPA